MTTRLANRFGLESRELISIVGAGGKTTILQLLGRELADTGAKVVLTTSTKIAADEIVGSVCWSDDPARISKSLNPGAPLFVLSGRNNNKATGLDPEAVDAVFASTPVDFVIVEADGARSKLIKAPADHEPAIPATSTTVVVVVGAGALGMRVGAVAHRVDRITSLAGIGEDDVLTPEAVSAVLLHPEGGLKGIPEPARVVMAITHVGPEEEPAATRLAAILDDHPRVNRCVRLQSSLLGGTGE